MHDVQEAAWSLPAVFGGNCQYPLAGREPGPPLHDNLYLLTVIVLEHLACRITMHLHDLVTKWHNQAVHWKLMLAGRVWCLTYELDVAVISVTVEVCAECRVQSCRLQLRTAQQLASWLRATCCIEYTAAQVQCLAQNLLTLFHVHF